MTNQYFKDISLDDLRAVCNRRVNINDYTFAVATEKNVLIYDGDMIRARISVPEQAKLIRSEWVRALKDGPGVMVIKKGYSDTTVIDRQTVIFNKIIAEEKARTEGKGDHFGNNERIWNAIQKSCEKDPNAFINYYSNELLAQICLAWLGPGYQITAQVNNVKPGSTAQISHRDYHLGFQSLAVKSQFARHAQIMSQFLTLQGAVAHTDMPLTSGPTLLLPFSQRYEAGYEAYEHQAFITYFNENAVQLPLEKGDMLFFNPALFHGAGANHSATDRLANLMQISSPFGRTMETLNTQKMIAATYPVLLEKQFTLSETDIHNVIAALANGYSFPTNLDADPPIDGNAPMTEQQLVAEALKEKWMPEQLATALSEMIARRRA